MRESGGHVVDPLADTMRFDLLGDTQPIERPTREDLFDANDVLWFDAGEQSAADEWAVLNERRAVRCSRLSLALAFAGSAALGILIAAVI